MTFYLDVHQYHASNYHYYEHDRLGILCTWHRRYDFTPDEVIADAYWTAYDALDEAEQYRADDGLLALDDPRILTETLAETDSVTLLPLYAYEHGDIAISLAPFSDGWDSGQLGFIFTTHDRVADWLGKTVTELTPEDLAEGEKIIKAEAIEFKHFVEGDIYQYSLYRNGEHVDSQGPFIGPDWTKNGLIDSLPANLRYLAND